MPVPPVLKLYRFSEEVKLPMKQTQGSACFDLAYNPGDKRTVRGFNEKNAPLEREINLDNRSIIIMPRERLLVPTGLYADIPAGYKVLIYARSSMALKLGLSLANSVGVVDSDYVDEWFAMLQNTSENRIIINVGDRIAQGELIENLNFLVAETTIKPTQKTDRIGGLGSTGR